MMPASSGGSGSGGFIMTADGSAARTAAVRQRPQRNFGMRLWRNHAATRLKIYHFCTLAIFFFLHSSRATNEGVSCSGWDCALCSNSSLLQLDCSDQQVASSASKCNANAHCKWFDDEASSYACKLDIAPCCVPDTTVDSKTCTALGPACADYSDTFGCDGSIKYTITVVSCVLAGLPICVLTSVWLYFGLTKGHWSCPRPSSGPSWRV